MLFREVQAFRQTRLRILTAIPPAAMTLLAIWQVGLGRQWGSRPMSNASVIGWTIFLWLVYVRLMTVKLVTEVRPGEVRIAMRGLWRSRRIELHDVKTTRVVTFDPLEWGGYGIRSTRRGTAFIAGGVEGVQMEMKSGGVMLIGSARASELARVIAGQLRS
jgi:hypothetical protein